MSDFIVDGQPFETPLSGAVPGYAQTPPSFADAAKAEYQEFAKIPQALRITAQSAFYPSTNPGADKSFIEASDPNSIPGAGGLGQTESTLDQPSQAAAVQTPTLSADEINDTLAPIGPDGKRVKITDAPMPEGAARLVAQAKADEIEREGILSRFSQAHPVASFAMGIPAFLADPVNLASTFLPGIGEESVLAAVGKLGFAANPLTRLVARSVAGASAGAVGQAPLSAMSYAMGQQEASDYGLRDAFRDMMFGAAAGAVLHAGFGAAGDTWKALRNGSAEVSTPPAGATTTPEAAAIMDAPAPVKADAMRAAVAQMVDGRPVDVPQSAGEGAPIEATAARVPDIGQGEARYVTGENGELLWQKASATTLPDDSGNQSPFGGPTGNEAGTGRTGVGSQSSAPSISDFAQSQQQLYRDGFQPGMTQGELANAENEMFGPRDGGAPQSGERPSAASTGETAPLHISTPDTAGGGNGNATGQGAKANLGPQAEIAKKPPAIATGESRYVTLGNKEYVAHVDGSTEFGTIPDDVAKEAGVKPGAILLPKGQANTTGELHMTRGGKADELKAAGYHDVGQFVDDIGRNFNEIRQGAGDSLILIRRTNEDPASPMMFVELKHASGQPAWEVKSGGVYKGDYTDGKEMLWRGERTPTTSTGETVPHDQPGPGKSGGASGSAAGQSSEGIIPQDPEIAKYEQALQAYRDQGGRMTAEEHAALDQTAKAVDDADSYQQAAQQAAQCLIDAGM